MNISDEILLLNNINFVITTTIVIMSIFIYYLKKQSYYICFSVVYFIEVIVFINLAIKGIYKGYDFALECMFITKILCIIINRNALKSNSLKKILLVIIHLMGLFITSYNIMIGMIINLLANSNILYTYIYKVLEKINNDLFYVRAQTKANERYIYELNQNINIEANHEEDLNKKEEELNSIYNISISKSQFPILILTDNSVKYANKKFRESFVKEDLEEFNIQQFFKDNFHNGENIIQTIQSGNNVWGLEIRSFKDRIYILDIFDMMEKNKNFKVFKFHDITISYHKKQKIKFNENSYKKLIEVMDDGVIIIDKNNINYMNNTVNNMFNIKNKVTSVEDLSSYISSVDREDFIKNILVDKSFQKNKFWYTKTCTNKILKVSQGVLNIKNKNLKLIIFSDITESQQLMENIEERETIYRVLLETLPDGIVIMNKSTQKHIYRNKYMIEQFKNIGIDRFNKIIEDYIDSAEFDKEKIVNLNKKQNASVLITDIKSENIYIIIFKILENNQKIRDIREKIKKTQQTESFKTQFCIDVVDKIKKPVDNLLYENSIMKDYAKSPIVENHVTLVRRNLYRLKKVLDNINDIMDIENRSYNLNYVVFDIVSLIKDISNLSKYYIDRKGLSLEIEFSDEEILVYLDSIKLQKIILNILSNAIKFTDKGGKIKISVYRKIDFIVINIKDSGIGIPKDQMNFIFENFEQIDRGLSRLAEGMGIGLYLVKQLAEIQDLYLNVDSELNKGSEFKILIKNRENSFLKKRYKKDICIKKEFVDIQFADIYPA